MSSIRNTGQCPCPHCKMPLSACHLFGTKCDRKSRVWLQHIDNPDCWDAVACTQSEIYSKKSTCKWGVCWAPSEGTLSRSNCGMAIPFVKYAYTYYVIRMHSQTDFFPLDLTCTLCLLLISCTRLSWGVEELDDASSSDFGKWRCKSTAYTWSTVSDKLPSLPHGF